MEAYFDNAASTAASPAALAALTEGLAVYANPASLHGAGFRAERLLNEAAGRMAAFLGCRTDETVWTSGGTESNNLAIRAARRGAIVTQATEHPSVLEAARAGGLPLRILPAGGGAVDIDELAAAVDAETALVSIMAVNNETGAVQPTGEIGRAVKRANPKALFHVDGAQAFGKIAVDLTHVDLYTVSGHKVHAPKGIGGLYVRRGVNVTPAMLGGGQQRGLRAGTENPAALAAFAAAAEEAFADMDAAAERVGRVRRTIEGGVIRLGGVINSPAGGSPYILNVSFPGVMAETMLNALSGAGVYISAGSACASRARAKRSRFETAYGWDKARADSALRFSFSRYNTMEEAGYAIAALEGVLPKLARRR